MDNDKTCFVICPIGDAGSEIRKWSDMTFKYIIKPVAEHFGYNSKRADHIMESGVITSQVIEQLIDSSLVIADLTNNNPNVYYELAIRHFTQKPYVQMMKCGQKIPFDVNVMRTIFFDNADLDLADVAKKELCKQIESIEKKEFKATNPITLAHNYSIIQKVLRDSKTDSIEDNVSKALLESINNMTFSLNELRKEVHFLKDSRDCSGNDRSVFVVPSYDRNVFVVPSKSVGLRDQFDKLLVERDDCMFRLKTIEKELSSIIPDNSSDEERFEDLTDERKILMNKLGFIQMKLAELT